MKQLPDYQSEVREKFLTLKNIIEKYARPDSCLGNHEAVELANILNEAQKHCDLTLKNCHPKVILFGLYNAGKSTLLNAMMGKNEASVADKPETYKVQLYHWNGYELLDTPGLDAPLEHEKISKEELKKCQVVLFVVSAAGTFEDKKIYEEMRAVKKMGKRLLIVMNDKLGLEPENEQRFETKDKIHKNLIKEEFDATIAADFGLYVVNAKYALDGRIDDDENLVEYSGIHELEKNILEEIKRMDGFSVIIDLLRFFQNTFSPYMEKISAHGSGGDREFTKEFQLLQEDYRAFCNDLEKRVDAECSPISHFLFNAIPLDGSSKDSASIQKSWEAIFERFHAAVWSFVKTETEHYRNNLALCLQRMLQNAKEAPFDGAVQNPSDANIKRIEDQLNTKPDFTPPPSLQEMKDGDENWNDKLTSLQKILPPLIAIPKIPTIPTALLFGAITVLKMFFGESKAERENKRIEAQAAAERSAQEEHARKMILWRQGLRDTCEDTHNEFLQNIKSQLQSYIKENFDPILEMAQNEYHAKGELGKQILEDTKAFSDLLIVIDQYIKELEVRVSQDT